MKKVLVLSVAVIVSLVGLYAFTNNAEGAYYTIDGISRISVRPSYYPSSSSDDLRISANTTCLLINREITTSVKISYNIIDRAKYYVVFKDGIRNSIIDASNTSNLGLYTDVIRNSGEGEWHSYYMIAIDSNGMLIDTSNVVYSITQNCGIPF